MERAYPGRYPLGAYGDGISHAIPELALRGVLKCGFVYHHNPLRTNPNPKRVIAGYKKLDLLVVIDPVLSETASIAHYVLPASFYLEADEAVDTKHYGKRAQVSIQQKVVEPLFDSRSGFQIIIDLAKHLGVGKYFNFTLDEANELRLKPLGVTLKDLKAKGVLPVGAQWKEGFEKLETPSGKVEIASSTLEKLGYPAIPRWEAPLVSPDEKDPHSFRLIHGKQAIHTHAMTANQPYLMADQPPVRHDPAVDQPATGGKDRPEGRGCGGNQIPGRRREDPGETDRGPPSLLRLAPQRLRDFFQVSDDGL